MNSPERKETTTTVLETESIVPVENQSANPGREYPTLTAAVPDLHSVIMDKASSADLIMFALLEKHLGVYAANSYAEVFGRELMVLPAAT
jgi:hypothetical protein